MSQPTPLRILMLLAALWGPIPCFEGMVVCHESDGRVALEPGSFRCADVPARADDDGGRQPALNATSCGSCVDVPLRTHVLAPRSAAPLAPRALPHTLAIAPEMPHGDVTAGLSALARSGAIAPPHLTPSLIAPPLRC